MAIRSVCPHNVCSQIDAVAFTACVQICCLRPRRCMTTAIGSTSSVKGQTCGALVHSGSPPMMLPLPDASFSTCFFKVHSPSVKYRTAAPPACPQSTVHLHTQGLNDERLASATGTSKKSTSSQAGRLWVGVRCPKGCAGLKFGDCTAAALKGDLRTAPSCKKRCAGRALGDLGLSGGQLYCSDSSSSGSSSKSPGH
jgi:hypothetical protein